MPTELIASSMERVTSVLRRKPQAGINEDTPATARWDGDLRVVARNAQGAEVATDMPVELGGSDTAPTPGWLLRAAIASCAVTRIAMAAAAEGIALRTLEARATSRSDLRGLFAMVDAASGVVPAGPLEVALHVRIGAPGVPAERLRALVEATRACSPVTCAIEQPLPMALHIEVEGAS
jgi:uncharacterized OsmC-like protein